MMRTVSFCLLAQCSHGLGGRKYVNDGIFFPGQSLRLIAMTAPDVDHDFAFNRRCEARAYVTALRKIALKFLAE